jgi:hypothetical protein
MASSGVPNPGALDSGPPLPPGMSQAPAAPSMSGLAGQSGQPQAPPGGASGLQSAIIQNLMLIEKALDSISSMAPGFAPYADQFRDQIRQVGGSLVSGMSQPQAPAPPSPLAAIAGSAGAAPQM